MKISATEFKAKCLKLIDQVHETGQPLVVTKHGKALIRIIPEHTENQPWRLLEGAGHYVGNPFSPAVEEQDIDTLQEK